MVRRRKLQQVHPRIHPAGHVEAPETEPEVVDVVDTTAAETTVEAPKTFDAGVIAAVVAIVSAAGYAVSKKH